jgi:hypothetical protein
MITLNSFNFEITDYKTYRSAYVEPVMCVYVDQKSKDALIYALNSYKLKLDNHICFRSGSLWFQYSDHYLYIGTTIVEKHW